MRKLKTSDIPAFCRCLKRIGIKDRISDIAKNTDKAKDAWSKGFDLIWNIFDIATEEDGEQHLYTFLAGPFEMSPGEIADMEIDAFLASLKQLSEENDLKGFFNSVVGSMKSK